MRVSELYDEVEPGQSVYIIGTGPSMRVFPLDYLRGKTCILLNDAHMHLDNIGPIAFSNNKRFLRDCKLPIQIVKSRLKFDPHPERDDNHVPWNNPNLYCFSYRQREIKGIATGDKWDHFDTKALWTEPDHYWNTPGGNVSIFAIQFALLAGFSEIHLVGCDCIDLNGYAYMKKQPGHGHKRRTRHDYDSYRKGTHRMIREARERFGVPIVQVNPFVGLGEVKSQFQGMVKWKT